MSIESRKFLAALRRQLDGSFNLSEIEMICFDAGVDFDHLPGSEKRLKIHHLILHMARRDGLADLLELLAEERPDLTWPAIPDPFDLGSEGDPPAGDGQVQIGNVGANAAVAVGTGSSVNVQTTNVQNYDFSGTIQGDVTIAGDVHVGLDDLPVPDPPPSPLPPGTAGFVGRTEELAKFKQQLAQVHLAVISGLAGAGKTMLAAVLAEQIARPEKIFWHTFKPGEGVETVVWQLAAFLAHHGQDDLWQLLQRTRLTRGAPPPAETLLNYLVEMLRGRGFLLVLDDIHQIDDDPQLDLFVERARRAVIAGDFSLIMTSRRLPSFVTLVETTYIPGLSREAAASLLAAREVILSPDLLDRLHAQTEGNPELLTLAAEMLREASHPELLLQNLSETDHVERFLLNEIDRHLTDLEPEVMSAVALLNLLGHRGTRDAIAAILGGQSVRRALRDLADRFLLMVQRTETGNEYEEHAIVQAFYYDALNRRQRQGMHRLAAAHYLEEEVAPLRAAGHLERAGAAEEAAGLVTKDVWTFINQGESRALRALLQRLAGEALKESSRRQVQLALGEVNAYLGENEAARSCFEAVLEIADGASTPLQAVSAYRGLGELLAQEDPQEALAWLQKGLDAIGELPAARGQEGQVEEEQIAEEQVAEEALLRLKIGTIHFWLGDLAAARPELERALALLPETPSQGRARALATLAGVIFEGEQDFGRALTMMEEALASAAQLRDVFQQSRILSTLAGYRFRAGDWEGALPEFREALALAERLGSEQARAIGQMNLGTALCFRGALGEGQHSLEKGLRLAEQTAQLYLKNMILISLADCHIRQDQADQAVSYLKEAAVLTEKLQDKLSRPLIQLGWVQIHLAAGETEAALQAAQESVTLNRGLGDPAELGSSLRIWGEALWQSGQEGDAAAAFAESEAVLQDAYPYETARTRMAWGRLLRATGQEAAGLALLTRARTTFQALGAQQELTTLAEIPGLN